MTLYSRIYEANGKRYTLFLEADSKAEAVSVFLGLEEDRKARARRFSKRDRWQYWLLLMFLWSAAVVERGYDLLFDGDDVLTLPPTAGEVILFLIAIALAIGTIYCEPERPNNHE
jgi:hypothetical protein